MLLMIYHVTAVEIVKIFKCYLYINADQPVI